MKLMRIIFIIIALVVIISGFFTFNVQHTPELVQLTASEGGDPTPLPPEPPPQPPPD